jgi:hypothetical protein
MATQREPTAKDQQALQQILARSATDDAFRRGLLSDPQRAIRQTLGIAIPPSFRLKFIERDPGVDALIVLPDRQSADGELSEEDLESIAGGADDGGAGQWSEQFGNASSW